MAGTVPAFQAVYHDYCVLFGNFYLRYEEPPYKLIPMLIGESFTTGDQLGWSNIWCATPGHPHPDWTRVESYPPSSWKTIGGRMKKGVERTAHIAQLRYQAGRKFLAYGEMLQPLSFENELPYIEGYWQGDTRRRKKRCTRAYQRRNGQIDLSTLSGPGFGYRLGEIKRDMPEPAARFKKWHFESL